MQIREDSPLSYRHNELAGGLYTDLAAQRHEAGLERLLDGVVATMHGVLLSEGDAAIDVGAGHGRHSLAMARAVGPTGRVWAFEPVAPVAASLQAAAAREGLGDVLTVSASMPAAASGEVAFPEACRLDHRDACEATYRLPPDPAAGGQLATVRTVRLDDDLQDVQRLVFVRCAAGGRELAALRGAAELLAAHRPVVVFEERYEVDRGYEHTAEAMFGFFDELGYTLRDAFGVRFLRHHWWRHGPWQVVASPAENHAEIGDLLSLCVARNAVKPR